MTKQGTGQKDSSFMRVKLQDGSYTDDSFRITEPGATLAIDPSVAQALETKAVAVKTALDAIKITTDKEVVAVSSETALTEQILTALGTLSGGTFPSDIADLTLTYTVNTINYGQNGDILVKINGANIGEIQATINVIVKDTTDPQITAKASLPQIGGSDVSGDVTSGFRVTVAQGTDVTESELFNLVTITDNADQSITPNSDFNTFDNSKLGAQVVTVTATDLAGNDVSYQVTINVKSGLDYSIYQAQSETDKLMSDLQDSVYEYQASISTNGENEFNAIETAISDAKNAISKATSEAELDTIKNTQIAIVNSKIDAYKAEINKGLPTGMT